MHAIRRILGSLLCLEWRQASRSRADDEDGREDFGAARRRQPCANSGDALPIGKALKSDFNFLLGQKRERVVAQADERGVELPRRQELTLGDAVDEPEDAVHLDGHGLARAPKVTVGCEEDAVVIAPLLGKGKAQGIVGRKAFIQTLTLVDVATGWTECLPLVARDGGLVVAAIKRAQSLFRWLLRGADFDNDSSFMNDVVVPWCRAQGIEVTRSRAYKKNDQAFVEQKNGAVVRRLVGYGRFEGVETAQVMARLYAAARLYVNFFQPSFKLKEKRREGAKVIKRYHDPATPFERALTHPKVTRAVKARLRDMHRTLDPVALLAEMRTAQAELGERIDRRPGGMLTRPPTPSPAADAAVFAKTLGRSVEAGEPRGTHRPPKRTYIRRVRTPSMLDPNVGTIEGWLVAEPQLTALAIVGRLSEA
jgi:hypothetical protein